jgi:hypothetical protein
MGLLIPVYMIREENAEYIEDKFMWLIILVTIM